MRNLSLLLILLILFFSVSINANEILYGSIEGVIIESDTKKPVEGVRIYVKGTDLIAITNPYGRFKIEKIPVFGTEREYILVITREGYRSIEKIVTIKANQTVAIDIEVLFILWQKTYGGERNDESYFIRQTTDKGYILAGWIESYGSGGSDIYISKLDKDGEKVWEGFYGGKQDDGAYSIQQTADGGYVAVGYTESFGIGGNDIYILKLDRNGEKVWEKTYGGRYNDEAYSIQQTTDGGYIVAGWMAASFGPWENDIYILKLDRNGEKVWEKTYGGRYNDKAYSIQQTTDGGYIVAGWMATSFGLWGNDIYILKLDRNGEKVWEKTYGGRYNDESYSIQQTSDGGYIVAGYTKSFGAGGSDIYILKLDGDGEKVWEKTYGGRYNDEAYSIQQTTDGGYIVAGYTESFGAGGSDIYILKLDKNGNIGPLTK